MKTGKFRYFDYGKSQNRFLYGHEEPPLIDLQEIQGVPVALFVGKQDSLGNVIDNRWVKDQLQDNAVHYEEIEASHASFVVGKDMSFFDRVIELVAVYNKRK